MSTNLAEKVEQESSQPSQSEQVKSVKNKRFLSLEDLSHMPVPTWAIEGMFERNSLVMLYGPPASYKSFLALDWMMCMASGRKWNGRKTTTAKVLYVLGEGKASLLKRIQVWCSYNQIDADETLKILKNFRASFDVPQLAAKSSVDNMLSGLVAEGFSPEVIIIDTFARSFVGLDENSQKDVGLWVENADRLRQLGYTVIFLHHSKKNTEFGVKYRGSSAIEGAMDTSISLTRDGESSSRLVLKTTKQKDHDEGNPLYFNRLVVKPFGPKDEGSCVLQPTVSLDERFSDEYRDAEKVIQDLMDDESYESDRARARDIALRLKISETAAQSRIKRRRTGLD